MTPHSHTMGTNIPDTADILLKHYGNYPQMQVADMLKLLYQNEFGCGHMVPDEMRSLNMILEETAALTPKALEGEAAEPIGNGLCRLHLRILRQDALSPGTLNRFFVLTAEPQRGTVEGFEKKMAVLRRLCEDGLLPFKAPEVSRILDEYRATGYPATHHSELYRSAYAPSYRVVDKRFCDVLPLFCRIDHLVKKKSRVVVAIDGGSAAGKSTLAALLQSVYLCNVFSMDDFFLRPFQRTPERLDEPGGNVDYERFEKEVLEPLKTGNPFSYRPYDCSVQELAEEKRAEPCSLNIVEGVYSLHPRLSDAYDLKVFLGIGPEEQSRRLLARNKEMYPRFVREWVPMENKYFDAFKPVSRCDLVFHA